MLLTPTDGVYGQQLTLLLFVVLTIHWSNGVRLGISQVCDMQNHHMPSLFNLTA